jgi:hypothetical protein
MKRTLIIVAIVLLLGLSVILLEQPADSGAPRFIPGQPSTIEPRGTIHYDWADPAPFQGGKVWIWVIYGPGNRRFFLYDLEKRVILGELINGGPVLFNAGQTELLCYGPASTSTSAREKAVALLKRLRFAKTPLQKINDIETFWILNVRNNSARRLGELKQIPGTGSTWRPSPGFRYGCNVPSNAEEDSSFFLCDLETGRFEKIRLEGRVEGWWDDHNLVIKDPRNNFLLFDVVARKPTTLFSAQEISRFLQKSGLWADPSVLKAFPHWNGSENEIYFTLQSQLYSAGECFLLKTDHTERTLKLLYPKFKFEHLGRLDDAATRYLYNGESGLPGRGGNGGVLLRDLSSNTTRTLVEPDNAGQYALPRFYADEVVYFRNKVPWRMPLSGTNVSRLFPYGQ